MGVGFGCADPSFNIQHSGAIFDRTDVLLAGALSVFECDEFLTRPNARIVTINHRIAISLFCGFNSFAPADPSEKSRRISAAQASSGKFLDQGIVGH